MYQKKSLGKYILWSLEKTVDGVVEVNNFVNHPSLNYAYPVKKSQLALTLKRLRENGLVDFVDDSKLAVRLTDKGREQALLAKLMLEEDKWDGKWRIVVFDIPEKRRLVRDLLRIKLKAWSFVPWQQSVWASRKNCTEPLRSYLKSIGIEDWVLVFESENIGR